MAAVLLDGFVYDNMNMISAYNIGRVYVTDGAILMYSKKNSSPEGQFHVKMLMPLGYQKPAEFYAPKYDTPGARDYGIPDLRTTIHWQPKVQTDDTGRAAFDFYTADAESNYTVVIEGVTDNGKIIYKKGKIERKGR